MIKYVNKFNNILKIKITNITYWKKKLSVCPGLKNPGFQIQFHHLLVVHMWAVYFTLYFNFLTCKIRMNTQQF